MGFEVIAMRRYTMLYELCIIIIRSIIIIKALYAAGHDDDRSRKVLLLLLLLLLVSLFVSMLPHLNPYQPVHPILPSHTHLHLTPYPPPPSPSPTRLYLTVRAINYLVNSWCVGTARGVVISVGDRTIMGRIANLASNVGFKSTTLAKEMQRFVNIIIFIAIVMGAIFFIIAMAIGYPWLTGISFLIGIITANVPEGLLSTICVSIMTEFYEMISWGKNLYTN